MHYVQVQLNLQSFKLDAIDKLDISIIYKH